MSLVRTDVSSHVATLTIAPPSGEYDRAFLDAVGAAAEALASDADVRCVVIAAEHDFGLGWAAAAAAEPDGLLGVPSVAAGVEAVARIPQPVVAALSGQVRSVALELALACDVRIASADARFALADTQAGAVPRAGGTQRLPRAVGRAQALRLILTGEEIDAQEARRIGLVSAVVPSADVLTEARKVADLVAQRGPVATRLAKEAVHRGVEMPLADALRYELDLTVLLQSTADRAEGVRAFAEKRPPRFIGQ